MKEEPIAQPSRDLTASCAVPTRLSVMREIARVATGQGRIPKGGRMAPSTWAVLVSDYNVLSPSLDERAMTVWVMGVPVTPDPAVEEHRLILDTVHGPVVVRGFTSAGVMI